MATSDAGARSDAVFELRPMNLADLLDAVVRLYRHNFGDLIRIAAVVHVPLGILQIASSALATAGLDFESPTPNISVSMIAGGAGMALYWLLFFLTMPIVQGAMAKSVAQSHLGEATSVMDAYRFALRRWFSLLMATLLQGIAHIGSIVVPLIPAGVLAAHGVIATGGEMPAFSITLIVLALVGLLVGTAFWTIVFIKLFFAPLTVVLEDRRPVEALGRSWSLTGGHFIRVALTMFIVIMLTVVLTYAVVIPAQLGSFLLQSISMVGAQALMGASVMVAQLLLQPVQIVATVLLYYDLRMRKEGFDLVMMAETIGEPQLAVRTPEGHAQPAAALYGPAADPSPTPNGADNEPRDSDHIP